MDLNIEKNRDKIGKNIIRLSWANLVLLISIFGIISLVGWDVSLQNQMIIYLIGMVALNLPHGGYEHFNNLRNRGLPFGTKYVFLYLTIIVAFVGLFFVMPLLALFLALAVAVAKGGHGDIQVLKATSNADHIDSKLQATFAGLVRGGSVMIVPYIFFTGTFLTFCSYMLSIFTSEPIPSILYSDTIVMSVGIIYGLSVILHILWGYYNGGGMSWIVDSLETILLTVYFAIVPAVVSIGLYFPLWYSIRQSGRSFSIRNKIENEQSMPVLVAWAALIGGAIMTGIIGVILWVIFPNPLGGLSLLPGLVAFYTIFICVVALPHVVIGQWWDDEGIWYVP